MTVKIDGTNTVANPAFTGADTDTGLQCGTNELKLVTGGTTRATIDSSGRLGIGTESPGAELEVKKSSTPVIRLNQNDTYYAPIKLAGNDLEIRGSSGQMEFFTGSADGDSSTERMRITDAGKAIFGGTTSTSAKWNFWDTDSTGMAWVYGTGSGNYRRAYLWGSSGSMGLYFTNGDNEAALTSAGAWSNASDVRIKKDIQPISYGLAEVMASQPRKYKLRSDDQDCIGFVAQEMLEIVPEVVTGGETEDRMYGLNYGALVAVAFKAIQEQQETIAALQTKNASLEARITALEGGS